MINEVTLIGNLGADPEIKTIPNGTEYAELRLATSESWQKDGEWQTKTEWHRVILWRNMAGKARLITKGDQIYLKGKITYRTYEDKNGNTKYITEIIGNYFKIMKRQQVKSEQVTNAQPEPTTGPDGDLPF